MSSSSDLLKKSQTLKKKKKIAKRIFLGLLFFLLFVGVNYLFFSSYLTINTIAIAGNRIVEKESILASASKALSARHFYIYPKKSILLYSKAEIAKQIETDWPIIYDVTVSTTGFGSISIQVKERGSDALWCDEQTACYFSDSTGYIFGPAPVFSDGVFLKLSGMLSAAPISTEPLSSLKYQAMTEFMRNLKSALISSPLENSLIKQANITDPNQYEIVLSQNQASSTEWEVILNTTLEPVKQINNLAAIVRSDQFNKDFKASAGWLDYIDLRFDQKVFYKFK